MKLLFITFENFETGASQLERLEQQLSFFTGKHNLHILCLNKRDNKNKIKQKYNNISFYYHEIQYNGWNVVNASSITEYVKKLDNHHNFDLVIQMMEVWDLLRELSLAFINSKKFAAIIHAVPFLGTPQNTEKDFASQLTTLLNSTDKASMKYDYISQHSCEVFGVMSRINIIAANKTVKYYMNHFFNNLKVWTLTAFYKKNLTVQPCDNNYSFDFLYMARIEPGKGLEYLLEIFKHISSKTNKMLKIGIAGRIQSQESQKELKKILSFDFKNLDVKYIGWADIKLKEKLFNSSSVFLYPSIYDTYAIVLRDAINHGMSAVAWKMPFTQINYKNCKSIKLINYKNFSNFAKCSLYCLENISEFKKESIKFAQKHSSPEDVFKKDLLLFKDIVRYNHAHNK